MAERIPDSSSHDQPFGFLPINQAESPPGTKPRRAYLSCERCRKRKTRCQTLPDQTKCQRCLADHQPCEFRTARSIKRRLLPRDSDHQSEITSRSLPEKGEMTNDPIGTPISRHTPADDLGQSTPSVEEAENSPNSPPTLNTRSRLVSTHIKNTSDVLDLLTFAGTNNQAYNNISAAAGDLSQGSATVPSISVDPSNNAQKAWREFTLTKKGILSPNEVVEYVDFFFDKLWPLKPVVPSYYRNKNKYVQLVVEEPLLVVCLVTLASRYTPLTGSHGEIRSERIHWQAWRLLQRYLQSAMWGASMTRSLGAISSMLLLIEWHTKAINNPRNFTEEDSETVEFSVDILPGFRAHSADTEALTGQRRYGMASHMENLDIVSPAYRSNKMSWMLLSNAIALAHEGCCFSNEPPDASTPSSGSDAMREEWSRVICVFIYLADESLATRLGLDPLLPEKSRQVVRDQFSATFAHYLPNSSILEGYFELSVVAARGRKFLHSLKKSRASPSDPNLIPHLQTLRRALGRWERQYRPEDRVHIFLNACLDIEFHYITIYCFAPAAQALLHDTEKATSENLVALSDFAGQALQACYALLSTVSDVLKPIKEIKYLPVRSWLFIVAASLHLLKVTLTRSQNMAEVDRNICLLRSVVETIRCSSPDDLHMAMRFSKFLGAWIQIAFPTRSSSATAPMDDDSREQTDSADQGYADLEETFYASALENMGNGAWDTFISHDVVSDPFGWWDSISTRNPFPRP